MNLYLWTYVSPVSIAYHNGGGVMIVAPSIERARALWAERVPEIFGLEYYLYIEDDPHTALVEPADKVFPLDPSVEHPEDLIIFADEGCC